MSILSHPLTLVLVLIICLFIISVVYKVSRDDDVNPGLILFALTLYEILALIGLSGVSSIGKTQHPKDNGILQEIQKQKEASHDNCNTKRLRNH